MQKLHLLYPVAELPLSTSQALQEKYHRHPTYYYPLQVDQLNQLVLDYCIPQVLGEAKGYMHYLKDVSTLPTPLDLPTMTFGGDNPDTVLVNKIGF